MGLTEFGLAFFVDEIQDKGPGYYGLGLDGLGRPIVLYLPRYNALYVFFHLHLLDAIFILDEDLEIWFLALAGTQDFRKLGLLCRILGSRFARSFFLRRPLRF